MTGDIDQAPAKRPRGRPPRVNQAQIVDAAITLFARFGYRNTTIAAIAQALGVTDGSVLHYFDSKRAILEAALAEGDQPAYQVFTEHLARGGVEALRGLGRWGEHMQTNPVTTSMHVLLSAESLAQGSELHGRFEARYRTLRISLAEAIQQGIDRGEFRASTDPLHEAIALLAFIDGVRLQWMLDRDAFLLDAQMQAYVEHLIERIATAKGKRRALSSL